MLANMDDQLIFCFTDLLRKVLGTVEEALNKKQVDMLEAIASASNDSSRRFETFTDLFDIETFTEKLKDQISRQFNLAQSGVNSKLGLLRTG